MNPVRGNPKPFLIPLCSAGIVPLLGLAALVLCLGNPQISARPSPCEETCEGTSIVLQDPDPRLDRCLGICLRQQAKEVARCRRLARPVGLARAIAGYNLIARECTPAVFQTTGLPPSLAR